MVYAVQGSGLPSMSWADAPGHVACDPSQLADFALVLDTVRVHVQPASLWQQPWAESC